MPRWNSQQYLQFQAERTQPAVDLAGRIALLNPGAVLDVGCGPGNSTQVLAERFPKARILGVDSSEEMLQTARESYPALSFRRCDASNDLPELGETFDVVFSNACLQWVPDHPKVFRQMMELLNPGGVLAVQVPMNDQEPIHQILSQTAQSTRWREKIASPRIFYTLSQEEYFNLLGSMTEDFTLWQTTYLHRMPSHQAIMEWYKGTGMRPYLQALPAAERPAFEQDVYRQVEQAYPIQSNGEIIFRFPRFFMLAVKQPDTKTQIAR